MANAIRFLTIDAVQKAGSGHPGLPMGMADVMAVLFARFIKFYIKEPKWQNRDRLILSAGHGSMLLYSIFYLLGYEDITIEDIKNFRQLHSRAAGHPEFELLDAIEVTAGPLGQGFASAVGMAIAQRLTFKKFNFIDHNIFAIVSDGCIMEGISHEVASLAGHLNLKNLVVLYDSNSISIDGSIDLTYSDDNIRRFEAYGWDVLVIDGHDYDDIYYGIENAISCKNPCLLICKTVIAKGSPGKAGSASSHGAPLGEEEVKNTRNALNWSHDSFVIPSEILKLWRGAGLRGKNLYEKWTEDIVSDKETYDKFVDFINKKTLPGLKEKLFNIKLFMHEKKPFEATRKTSGNVLKVLYEHFPYMIGGSADLSASNCTKVDAMEAIHKNNWGGSYIYYGIREHAMAGIMNGIALYGGFLPYGGTFLVFADYCRPAIRLAALMKLQVVYVMTHDSIGVGEDGPTHQPVEHLASLRAIPDLFVFRPADSRETIECWQIILQLQRAPSVLVLTRQNVEYIKSDLVDLKVNNCISGAYIVKDVVSFDVTIFATGSEVAIAMKAGHKLDAIGIKTRVVTMPCWLLFEKQSKEYKDTLLNNRSIKVAVEAGVCFGWERYIGRDGIFIGMKGFGASGAAADLFDYYNINCETVVKRVREKYENKVI